MSLHLHSRARGARGLALVGMARGYIRSEQRSGWIFRHCQASLLLAIGDEKPPTETKTDRANGSAEPLAMRLDECGCSINSALGLRLFLLQNAYDGAAVVP